MEKFQVHREAAKKKLKVADHLLTITYPMVKDPKLLLSVLDNLYQAMENGMNSVLEYEILFKHISGVPQAFEPRVAMFKKMVCPKHDISDEQVELIKRLKDTISSHKEAAVEFSRQDKFVIASDNYRLRTVSPDSIKKDIAMAKKFMERIEEVVSEHEGIFG
ncbi:hypothetical protein ACFL1B_01180 [Nanoarchaeota archaeon]